MKNIISRDKRVYFLGTLFWVALFLISAIFIDPTTKEPVINNYLFHFVLFLISLCLLYPVFNWFKKKGLTTNATLYTFVLINILLDIVILIGFIKVSFNEWILMILPAYIIGALIIKKFYKIDK